MIYKIKRALLKIKYAWQRVYRGYDDLARWNLCNAIADISLPILDEMAKNVHGYPPEFKNLREWKKALVKMKKGFEAFNDLGMMTTMDANFDKKMKEQEEGLKLFAEHLTSLWD